MRLVAALLIVVLGLPAQADLFGRRGGPAPRLDTPYLPPGRDTRDNEQPQRHGLTPGEAAQRAQAMAGGGRVLSVEPMGEGYRVKLLRNGEVRVVVVH
jgi:hypothetical protein